MYFKLNQIIGITSINNYNDQKVIYYRYYIIENKRYGMMYGPGHDSWNVLFLKIKIVIGVFHPLEQG